MKIEIILCENISETCTGLTCFEAPKFVSDLIMVAKPIKGIVIVDNEVIKFSFSPAGMDGDIFSDNINHRRLIKYLIPLFVANSLETN